MSDISFFTRPSDARSAIPLGLIGALVVGSWQSRETTVINTAGQAAQVTTIASPASPDSSTAYSVTVDGVSASFTTDASATQDELGAGLESAINAEPGIRGQMSASYNSSTNVLTLTGVYPGVSHTVTVSGGSGGAVLGAPTTATSASAGTSVPFGVAVVQTGFTTDGSQLRKGAAPKTTTFTAQVMTITIATGSGASFTATIDINGKRYTSNAVVHDTDAATTATALAAAINAVMPVETVIATTSTADLILTAEVEGAEFEAMVQTAGSASADATKVYTTGPSISTSLARALVGISARALNVENATIGGDDPVYIGNSPMRVGTQGRVIVSDRGLTISAGDEAYVSVGSSTPGYIYNAAGTDRVWVPPALLRWETQQSSDGTAVIAVNTGSL
jgi:hypothetical protein